MKARYFSSIVVAYVLSFLVLVLLWHVSVREARFGPTLVPTPRLVFDQMFSTSFLRENVRIHLVNTFGWAIISWIGGMFLTALLSLLSERIPLLRHPVVLITLGARTLPSVVAVPIFGALFGIERTSVFLCATFLVGSYSYPALDLAVRSSNETRRTLTEALGLRWWQSAVHIVLPGIGAVLQAISIQSFGIALVVTVAGEMILSIENTVGYEVAQLSWLQRMTEVYAFVGWFFLGSATVLFITLVSSRLLTLPARLTIRRWTQNLDL